MTEVSPQPLPIAVVEADSGIPRATLRIWERRYGFPQPLRDQRGERGYPAAQVEKLRLMRRLLELGHRPAQLVEMGVDELARLARGPRARGTAVEDVREDAFIRMLKAHDMRRLVGHLRRALDQKGLESFVTHRLPRLNAAVGEAWAQGQLQVFEEHLYSDGVQQVLRGAIAALDVPASARPRVLLATFPQELHGLGLLMAWALLGLHGANCMSLGVNAPVAQVAAAAVAHRADIVGLSFSAGMNPGQAARGLQELRGLLPPRTEIWAGGSCTLLARRKIGGALVMPTLEQVGPELERWRAPTA